MTFGMFMHALLPALSPTVVEEPVVEIESGRHPVIDLLLAEGEQYVANSTKLNVRDCICNNV